ncbi:MAG: MCE family protein, partial [Epsilonproteobacteria bacterium]|nr:MCE family protein [Campylobacterota bacterium]
MSYNKMRISVTIFTVVTTVAIFIALFFVLKSKGLFDKQYTYAFYANDASSFNIGTPIKYAGFEIGHINKIGFTYDGKVFVHFVVSSKYAKWINKRAYLELKKPLIGGSVISVVSDPNYPEIKPNAILDFEVKDDINSLIERLKPIVLRIENIIKNTDKIVENLASKDGALNKTMNNIEKITAKFADNKSIIDAAMGETNSSKNITQSIAYLKESMKEVQKMSAELNSMLLDIHNNILKPSEEIPKNVNDILIDIKNK